MVVLWSQAENTQRPSVVLVHVSRICLSKQARDGEFPSFDPNPCCFVDSLERHQSTVCTGDESVRVTGVLNRPSVRFEFPGWREKISVGCGKNVERRTDRRTR